MNGNSPKLPTTPPLPLTRHFPQRGQQGNLGSPVGELSSKARLRGCRPMNGTSSKIPTIPPLPLPRHFPQRGQQGKLGSPVGELSSKARLRGCCSLNGTSPKLPTTPPLPLRGTKQRYDCHRQSLYLDSLRGAPPPAGAARGGGFWGQVEETVFLPYQLAQANLKKRKNNPKSNKNHGGLLDTGRGNMV